ncbi:transposase [Chitinispirillum alkaliphilum]|nr:transposase [Chitinispirillum alkaliphilum]
MKPGVYTQLYVQIVFAVKNRQCFLRNKERNEEIFRYISGTVSALKNKSIIVNGAEDHVHIFLGLHHTVSISELAGTIKKSSSSYINDRGWFYGKFSWQNGYGAFTYSRSHLERVYRYIQNQGEHHKKITFRDEYITLLEKFEIEYDEKYLFTFF